MIWVFALLILFAAGIIAGHRVERALREWHQEADDRIDAIWGPK